MKSITRIRRMNYEDFGYVADRYSRYAITPRTPTSTGLGVYRNALPINGQLMKFEGGLR